MTERCNYLTLKQAWDDREVSNQWHAYLREKKKAEELAKATGSVKKQKQQNNIRNHTDDTQSEDN